MDRPSLNVFRTRAMVQGRPTAVCIALDASGSMTTQKMDVARASMRVLLEAQWNRKIARRREDARNNSVLGEIRGLGPQGEGTAPSRSRL